MFFSFDGIDGVGKSTQLALFVEWLAERGHEVVACRDPGSTSLGERIRQIVLAHDPTTSIHRRAEMLLYMAARAQLVEELIRPALAEKKMVVSDRFLLANIVYQAYAGGLPIDNVRRVGEVTIDGITPDAVFLLDMDPHAADARLDRQRDRMEQQGTDFRRRLREGFLAEALLQPATIHVIDAGGTIDEVQNRIRTIAAPLL